MSDREPEESEKGVRERILDAAVAILSEDGISGLSQVQVSRRAEVRQSHLTYYFPKRHDLISAIAERVVGSMARHVRDVVPEAGVHNTGAVLEHLADAVTTQAHMRMFIGTIVEADRDPEIRAILMRETARLQDALAHVLAGAHAAERARLLLASLWGLGLYAFLAKEPAGDDLSLILDLSDPTNRG